MIEYMNLVNANGQNYVLNDMSTGTPINNFTSDVDPRFTERQKSQQHGIYQTATYWGKRTIHMEGNLIGANASDWITKRNTLMGVLMPRPQLGIKKMGTLYILWSGMAEQTQIDVTLDSYPSLPLGSLSPANAPFQLNFKAFDPRYYGALQSTTLPYGIADNIGGRVYNKTYNKVYTGSSSGSSTTIITNGGNVETYPVVTFRGPVTDPRISFQRSDGVNFYMTLTGLSLTTTSDSATVDFANRTVTRWDGSNLYNYSVGSDWFAIEPYPFTNVVRFTGSSGNSTASAQVQWRNAYML